MFAPTADPQVVIVPPGLALPGLAPPGVRAATQPPLPPLPRYFSQLKGDPNLVKFLDGHGVERACVFVICATDAFIALAQASGCTIVRLDQ